VSHEECPICQVLNARRITDPVQRVLYHQFVRVDDVMRMLLDDMEAVGIETSEANLKTLVDEIDAVEELNDLPTLN